MTAIKKHIQSQVNWDAAGSLFTKTAFSSRFLASEEAKSDAKSKTPLKRTVHRLQPVWFQIQPEPFPFYTSIKFFCCLSVICVWKTVKPHGDVSKLKSAAWIKNAARLSICRPPLTSPPLPRKQLGLLFFTFNLLSCLWVQLPLLLKKLRKTGRGKKKLLDLFLCGFFSQD